MGVCYDENSQSGIHRELQPAIGKSNILQKAYPCSAHIFFMGDGKTHNKIYNGLSAVVLNPAASNVFSRWEKKKKPLRKKS
jgi:hypothetical protein